MSVCPRDLAVLAFTLAALASPPRARAADSLPPVAYQNFHHVLPSGLRVVAYQLGGTRLVSVSVSYLGGMLSEPPGKEGVAEIAMRVTSGLAGRGDGEGFGESRQPSIGERLLAETSWFDGSVGTNAVFFSARAPPGRLDAILALEAERLRDPLAGVGEEHFERVRAGFLDEIAEAERSPSTERARWGAMGRVLPVAIARPRPATRESVQSITWEDVRAYAAGTFRPENAVVAVVGPSPVRAVGRAAVGAFHGPGPEMGPPVLPARRDSGPAVPLPGPRGLETFRGQAAKPRLWVAWLLPTREARDPVANTMAFLIASISLARASSGVGVVTATSLDPLDDFVLVSGAVDLARAEDASTVLQNLALVSMPQWTQGPVQAVMELGRAQFYRMLEDLPGSHVADMVRNGEARDPVGDAQDRFVRPVDEATWNVARNWVRREAVLSVLESPAGEQGGTATEARGVAATREAAADTSEAVPSWIVRLPPGRYDVYSMAQPPGLSGAWRDRLENGLEVIAFPRKGFPRIAARLVVRTEGEASHTLSRLALAGRTPRPRLCPALEPVAGPTSVLWTRDVPAGSLDGALDDLACNVVGLELDRSAFAMLRDREVKGLEREEKSAGKSVARAATAAATAFDPGSITWRTATADEVDDLSKGQAEDWVNTQLRPERATLVLVGDLPAQDQVMVYVGARFRNWKGTATPATSPRAPVAAKPAVPDPPVSRSVFVGDLPELERALVRIHVRWLAGATPDVPAEYVVLGEVERRVLREQRYGVRKVEVRRGTLPRNPFLQVTFEVRPGQAAEAVRKALEAIATVAEAPVLEENVQFQRWMMARRFPDRFASLDGLAEGLVEQVVQGRPPEWWDLRPASISGLSTLRVEAAARRLAVGREVVLVVGPRDTIAASLAREGLPVEKPGS